jgi:hypothetical protein
MWSLIDTKDIIANLCVGNIICNEPGDPSSQFEIRAIHQGYVKLLHANGRQAVKIIPEANLITDKWWFEAVRDP